MWVSNCAATSVASDLHLASTPSPRGMRMARVSLRRTASSSDGTSLRRDPPELNPNKAARVELAGFSRSAAASSASTSKPETLAHTHSNASAGLSCSVAVSESSPR